MYNRALFAPGSSSLAGLGQGLVSEGAYYVAANIDERLPAVRWDELFADLEAQAEALTIAERGAEIDDRTRYEAGQLAFADRLLAAVGDQLRFRCRGETLVSGVLRRAHPEWLLVEEGAGREALVMNGAVCSVSGLGRQAAASGGQSPVLAKLGVRYALRTLVRDRSGVRLHYQDGSVVDGTLDRVGADFVELATHPAGEPRRAGAVVDVLCVPFGAIAVVRRDG